MPLWQRTTHHSRAQYETVPGFMLNYQISDANANHMPAAVYTHKSEDKVVQNFFSEETALA